MNYQPKLLKCAFNALLTSLAMVVLLALPGRAVSAPVPLSFEYMTYPTVIQSWYGASPLAGVFSNDFSFTVGTQTQLTLQNEGTWLDGFSVLTAKVFDTAPTPNLMATGAWLTNSTPTTLAAGNYILNVSGKSLYDNVGYAGSLTLSTAPIPEPETYAMMLAGLGLMGFMARRRKQNDAAA